MSTFTSPLVVEYLDERWRSVYIPFSYAVGSLEAPEEVIEVPVGFHTDYATIPKFLHFILAPAGKWAKAAVIHDYLYAQPGTRTRKECDDIFFEGMCVLGVSSWKKYAAYFAVRLFGWKFWKKR